MSTLGAKLEIRISAAKTAGKDTTKLETTLADLKTKLVDAQTQYNGAVSAVVPLVPDQGDKATMDANKAAFAKARSFMKLAMDDFKAARVDIRTLVLGVEAMKIDANATTTTTVTP
jgi:hypothetical protein